MTYTTSIVLLLCAAVLEAGGDALMRRGLQSSAAARVAFLAAGGVVLTIYGWAVNAPPWEFGKLLGVYVVFFFIIAQAIAWAAFGQPPTLRVLVGGALILAGGIVVSGA
jgi:small multidrug resistance family-3 protein